jgi:Zn-dependent protease
MLFNLNLPTLISRLFVLLTAFAVHEFAHAFVADRFGDDTPRMNGRLTLNPLAHLDPMGSLMLVLVGFGWAKPVPINPYALSRRSSSAVMWVSLAGPGSNFLMAVFVSLFFRVGLVSVNAALQPVQAGQILPTLDMLLFDFIYINLLLMVFNLIPISPLDGEKILYYLLPVNGQRFMDNIRPYGPMILIGLFALSFVGFNVIGSIISPAINSLMSLLL